MFRVDGRVIFTAQHEIMEIVIDMRGDVLRVATWFQAKKEHYSRNISLGG